MTAGGADMLALVQWMSPAFPVGAFAYSHGLEAAIHAGDVSSAASLSDWLRTVLEDGTGAADASLLAAAMDPDADLAALEATARALAGSAERWHETSQQGRAFADAQAALQGEPACPLALPLAVGRAARTLSLPPEQVVAHYLHAFASNLVSAAVRFVPLGQSDGQRVLADLHPTILSIAQRGCATPPDEIVTCALGADLAAMTHETQDVRMFKT